MSLNDEYRKFWKSLKKEQREALSACGFDPEQPQDDGVPKPHRYFWTDGSGEEGDSEGRRTDGYDINYRQAVVFLQSREEVIDVIHEVMTRDEVLDVLSKVLSVMTDCNDPGVRLQGTCIKLALGMPGQPTMTSLAEENGITRAAVSLRVKTIQRKLGLPPSVYMKSEHACKKLSRARRNK